MATSFTSAANWWRRCAVAGAVAIMRRRPAPTDVRALGGDPQTTLPERQWWAADRITRRASTRRLKRTDTRDVREARRPANTWSSRAAGNEGVQRNANPYDGLERIDARHPGVGDRHSLAGLAQTHHSGVAKTVTGGDGAAIAETPARSWRVIGLTDQCVVGLVSSGARSSS